MRTLTINYGPGVDENPNFHGFEVVDEYGRTTGHLCFGELIEQVTGMVHPKLGGAPYAMCTPEQWALRWTRQQDRIEMLLGAGPAPELLTEDPDHGEHLEVQ